MICLLLCWLLPVAANVVLFVIMLVFFVLGLATSLFKHGAGLGYLVATFVFGLIMAVILFFQIAALGRKSFEEYERQNRMKQELEKK